MIDIFDNRDNLVEELDLLERLRLAYLRRKLHGGILLIPDELTYAIGEEEISELEETLVESMVTTLQFPDSLGALLPVVIRGSEELLKEVRLIKLSDESMLDVEMIEKRIENLKERIKRFDEFSESMVQ
jgi:hypothetical protein